MKSAKPSLGAILSVGAVVAALAIAGLSLVHPWGNLQTDSNKSAPILVGSNAPDDIRAVLEKKCGDCHSNNTRWPVYSRVAPSSWLVEHDVHEGRQHMNLSLWEQYSIDNRIDLLGKMRTQLRQGKMPLKQYLLLHPEARLSESEGKLILDWIKLERTLLVAEAAK
jgi:cytochrome c